MARGDGQPVAQRSQRAAGRADGDDRRPGAHAAVSVAATAPSRRRGRASARGCARRGRAGRSAARSRAARAAPSPRPATSRPPVNSGESQRARTCGGVERDDALALGRAHELVLLARRGVDDQVRRGVVPGVDALGARTRRRSRATDASAAATRSSPPRAPKSSRSVGRLSVMAWTKPPLRPLGPKPQRSASSRTIRRSGSASSRCHAVHRPGEPAADDHDVGVGVAPQRRQRRRARRPRRSTSRGRRAASVGSPARPRAPPGRAGSASDAGWPSCPSSETSRPKSELDVPVDEQAQLALRRRASSRGGSCGPAPTRCRPRQRRPDASRPPPGPGPCRRTRRASGSANGRTRPVAERRGDVAPDAPALAQRVLAGRRARRARASWPGPAPPRRRRSPTRSPGPRRASSCRPRSGRRRRAGGRGARRPDAACTPAVHTHVRVGTTSPSLRRAVVGVTSSSVVSVRISIPRPRSSRLGELRERRRDLGHDAVASPRRGSSACPACGSAGSGRSRRRRSPAARRGPRAPRSPRRRRRTSATPRARPGPRASRPPRACAARGCAARSRRAAT